MQTPHTGTTASAPEHDSSTAQLDGEESDRQAKASPAKADEPAPAPGSRPGPVPGTETPAAATETPAGTGKAVGAPAAGRRTVALAVAGLTAAVLLLSGLSLAVGAGEVGVGGVLDYLLNRDGAARMPVSPWSSGTCGSRAP